MDSVRELMAIRDEVLKLYEPVCELTTRAVELFECTAALTCCGGDCLPYGCDECRQLRASSKQVLDKLETCRAAMFVLVGFMTPEALRETYMAAFHKH